MHAQPARSVLALLATAALTASALAQQTTKGTPPAALGGPAVKDPGPAPGVSPTLDGGQRGDRKDKTPAIPHRVFMKALHDALDSPDDASLRLTPEQSAKIDAAARSFEDAQAAYMREHRDQIEELRKGGLSRAALAEARGKGGANRGQVKAKSATSGDASATPDQQRALLQKAKELRDAAPKPDDTRATIWAVLGQPQQVAVEAKLRAFRDKLGEKYVERQAKRRKGGADAPAVPRKKPG